MTTMESMYIFASTLHPSIGQGSTPCPGLILCAYDGEGTATIIHVLDPSYTICIPWEIYTEKKDWVDSHSAVHVRREGKIVCRGKGGGGKDDTKHAH